MKKFSVILIVLVFSVSIAYAAQVGSPASMLKKGEWDFAIQGGGVFERPMKSSTSSNYHVDLGYGYHSRSYGLTESLMITGKIGGGYGYLYDESVAGAQSETSLGGGLLLGLQLKGTIWEYKEKGWEWDGSGQYLYLRSHHKRSNKANVDWYEWQLASCLIKDLKRFKPYAGVKFSMVDLDHDDGQGTKAAYEADDYLGLLLGTDIYFGEDQDVVVNLEAGFLTGTELFIGLKYRF